MTVRRLARAASVVLLAVAVGVPAVWWAGRPDAAAGVAVVTGSSAAAHPEVAAEVPVEVPARAAVTAVDRLPTLSARPAAAGIGDRADTAAATAPVRVQVPSLGIDADVVPVGVRRDRRDGAARRPAASAGGHPARSWAAAGSAVLAGHVDTAEVGLGALAVLRIEPGAEVVVGAADGTSTRWRVVGRERVDKAALPVDDLFRRDGPARLVIVTCGGEYLPEVPGYRDNVVVVAERSG